MEGHTIDSTNLPTTTNETTIPPLIHGRVIFEPEVFKESFYHSRQSLCKIQKLDETNLNEMISKQMLHTTVREKLYEMCELNEEQIGEVGEIEAKGPLSKYEILIPSFTFEEVLNEQKAHHASYDEEDMTATNTADYTLNLTTTLNYADGPTAFNTTLDMMKDTPERSKLVSKQEDEASPSEGSLGHSKPSFVKGPRNSKPRKMDHKSVADTRPTVLDAKNVSVMMDEKMYCFTPSRELTIEVPIENVKVVETDTTIQYHLYGLSKPQKADLCEFAPRLMAQVQLKPNGKILPLVTSVRRSTTIDKATDRKIAELSCNYRTSTIWSVHRDYQPAKRFNFDLNPVFRELTSRCWFENFADTLDHYMKLNPTSPIKTLDTWTFVPREWIDVHFNLSVLCSKNIQPWIVDTLVACVSNQKHSRKQYTELVAILAAIEMMASKYQQATITQYIKMYWTAVFGIAASTERNRPPTYTIHQLLEDLAKHPKILPYAYKTPGVTAQENAMLISSEFPFESSLSCEDVATIKVHRNFEFGTLHESVVTAKEFKFLSAVVQGEDIEIPKANVLELYERGLFRLINPVRKIASCSMTRKNTLLRTQNYTAAPIEGKMKMIMRLVISCLETESIDQAISRTLAQMPSDVTDLEYLEFVQALAKTLFFDRRQKGLSLEWKALNKLAQSSENVDEFEKDLALIGTTSEIKLFTSQQKMTIIARNIAMIMSGQLESWHKLLYGEEHKDYHCHHVSFLKDLYELMPKATSSTESSSEDEEQEPSTSTKRMKKFVSSEQKLKKDKSSPPPETKDTFSRVVSTWESTKKFLGAPFEAAKKHARMCDTAVDTMESMRKQLKETFNKAGMGTFVPVVSGIDFTSISGSIDSVKHIINSAFMQLVQSIAGLFGVEVEDLRVEPTVLLFYYFVWKNTDSRIIRTWIVFDILARCKLLDATWAILKMFWNQISKLRATANFDEAIAKMEEDYESLTTEEKIAKDKCEKPAETFKPEEKSTFCMATIIDALSSGTPAILGALGVALVSYLGYAATNNDNVGKQITQAMRNIGFIGMGLAAAPKIYSHILAVISWATDHIKGIFDSKHESERTIALQMKKWIEKTAVFQPGMSEKCFSMSMEHCLHHEMLFNEGIVLNTKMMEVKNVNLIMCYKEAMSRMRKLSPAARNFQNIHAGIDEPMSIVLSGLPGIGKTDLSKLVCAQIGKVLVGKETVPYPLNDALSYMDNYAGQPVGLIDDEMVFSNPDPGTVLQKLNMLGGNVTLCNMASLEQKGAVMKFKLVVSNTNNPFATIDKLITMEAVYRRRTLIEAVVRDDCMSETPGNKKVLDPQKIKDLGINRTQCEHLLFRVCHPINPGEYLLMESGAPQELSIHQLIQYLSAKARNHQKIESTRAKITGVDKTVLRNAITEIDQLQAESMAANNRVLLSKIKDQLSMYLDTYNQKFFAEMMLKDMKLEGTSSIEELNNKNAIFFDLKKLKRGWTIVQTSAGARVVESHIAEEIDAEQIDIGHNGTDELLYVGKLSDDQLPTLLYWFEKMVASGTHDGARKILEHMRHRSTVLPMYKKWKDRVTEVLSNAAISFGGFLKTMAKTFLLAIGCGIMGGLVTAVAMISVFFVLEGLCMLLGPSPTASYNGKQPVTRAVASHETFYNQLLRLAESSVYEMSIKTEFTKTSFQGVAIGQENYLINAHSAAMIKQDSIINIYDPISAMNNPAYEPKGYPVTPSDIHVMNRSDAVILTIRGCRPTRSVLKHFVTEADLGQDCCNFADFDGVFVSSQGGRTTYTNRQNLTCTDYGTPPRVDGADSRNIRINGPVKSGVSGALVVHMNSKIERPFLGIMMSTTVSSSYATIVTQEMIKSALSRVNPVYKIETTQPMLEHLTDHELIPVIQGLELFVSNQSNQSISTDCEFIKSPIHGAFPVKTTPAIVDPKDPRCEGKNHPYSTALNKYSAPSLKLTREEYEAGTVAVKNLYSEIPNVNSVRVYSTVEAITGTRSQGSSSLDVTTSPGLPYKDKTLMKGKTEFIRHNPTLGSWEISDVVFRDVELYEESYAKSIVPLNYKTEFIKHELVGENKITTPKTRTVGTGNMIQLVIYRKCTSDLYRLEKLNTRKRNHCAIGINPESKDWDCLAHDNLEYLNNIISIDVKSWESVVDLNLLRAVTEAKIQVIENAYRRREQKLDYPLRAIMHAIAVDYTDSIVCFQNIIVRKRHGMLSGHPGTLPENSDIHALILFTIWCRRMRAINQPGLATYVAWRHHMRIIVAGDDCLIALSDKGRSLMSVDNLVSIYNDLGMKVTAADKTEHFKFEHLEDVEFLKMGFKLTQSGYTMFPNESIYHQLLNWIRKGKNTPKEQFQINVLTAMRFAFFRGQTEYEAIHAQLNDALAKASQKPFTISYEEMAYIIGRDIEHTYRDKSEKFVKIMADGDYDERPIPKLTDY